MIEGFAGLIDSEEESGDFGTLSTNLFVRIALDIGLRNCCIHEKKAQIMRRTVRWESFGLND